VTLAARDLRPADRLDKWLWWARFFKTRGLAAKTVSAARVRVNGAKVSKPATAVRMGDVLTFVQGRSVRVVRIVALPARRGPAPEARLLYDDLSPPSPASTTRAGPRPTKKARRHLEIRGGGDPGGS